MAFTTTFRHSQTAPVRGREIDANLDALGVYIDASFVPLSGDWDGWIGANETWTYASGTTFTVSGDVTGKYQAGDKIKLTQTTVKYFYVVSASHAAGTTTITVTGGSDYSLANAAITSPYYSKLSNQIGFPHWFNYSPTYGGAGSLTYTSVSTSLAKFRIIGKECFVALRATGTTGGTTNKSITFTLPVTPDTTSGYYFGAGVLVDASNTGIAGVWITTVGNIRRHDNANVGLGAGVEVGAEITYGF